MIFSRFSTHSTHSSLKQFHHLKQQTSVSDYIQKFEELMALMQMQHPKLTKQYYISSFIAGLKEGVKHYLVPHNPQSLSDTYWQAKELEKGILVKKSLLSPSSPYIKPNLSSTLTPPPKPTQQQTNPPIPKPPSTIPPNNQPNRPIPIKPREQGKWLGYQEPWTPKHKFQCKF
jgi:hypothetical protein